MQTSQNHQGSGGGVHELYHQTAPQMSPCNCLPHIQITGGDHHHPNACPSKVNQQGGAATTTIPSSEAACSIVDGYFTLNSSTPSMKNGSGLIYDSPQYGPSTSSNWSASFSPLQEGGSGGAQYSYVSDPHDNTTGYDGSPLSGSSAVESNNNGIEQRNKMKEVEQLLGLDSAGTTMMALDQQANNNSFCSFRMGGFHEHDEASSSSSLRWNQMMELIPRLDLVAVLCKCAEVVDEKDLPRAADLMELLGQMVSVSGTPIQRLAAYMLEGLRARLEASGYNIYKTLRCEPPTSKQLLSYMQILYIICPYYKFAYMSSNAIIREAMQEERSIHIIDFQVAMGSQWIDFIQDFARRPGGAPSIRVTGVDDANSAFAREGGLELVGKRLAKVADRCGVRFAFHAAAMSGCEVRRENLGLREGEAVAVNFPYMLHHMPDESVSTSNHRDRLLRLVKSLSPKVVVLVEQESNTNTPPFHVRFRETLEYYTAMFESIDVARAREEEQRIHAEQHCLARDIVNMIACEGEERVERHELLGKWKARLTMAGFEPHPVSCYVERVILNMLEEYDGSYRLTGTGGCLYLGWKEKNLATCSAWF